MGEEGKQKGGSGGKGSLREESKKGDEQGLKVGGRGRTVERCGGRGESWGGSMSGRARGRRGSNAAWDASAWVTR